MTTYEQEHPEDNAIILWLATLVLAGIIGFGVAASLDLDLTDLVVDPKIASPNAQTYPDWHGNVRRSQGL